MKSEVQLARAVIAWLRERGWEIYQEVEIRDYDIADIIATQGKLVWIIEAKLALNLTLLAQAHRWTRCAHYVSIAVPAPRRARANRDASRFARKVASDYGMGCFDVNDFGHVVETVDAPLRRVVNAQLVHDALREEHKTYAEAGSATGRRWTPWKETCARIKAFVTEHPGVDLKTLVDAVKHHYRGNASARSALRRQLERGVIEGVRYEMNEGKIQLFSINEAPL